MAEAAARRSPSSLRCRTASAPSRECFRISSAWAGPPVAYITQLLYLPTHYGQRPRGSRKLPVSYLGNWMSDTARGAFLQSPLILTELTGLYGRLTLVRFSEVVLPMALGVDGSVVPPPPDKLLISQLYLMLVYSRPICSDF